jgi:predicted RNA-binding Zn-ribbon protein involved in translation (DUF1610 family)
VNGIASETMPVDMETAWRCPRCGAWRSIEERPAHSVFDRIEICQPCGFEEGQGIYLLNRPAKPVAEWAFPPKVDK